MESKPATNNSLYSYGLACELSGVSAAISAISNSLGAESKLDTATIQKALNGIVKHLDRISNELE